MFTKSLSLKNLKIARKLNLIMLLPIDELEDILEKVIEVVPLPKLKEEDEKLRALIFD